MIHRLDCTGCGEALPPEPGRRGSLHRLHPECRTVKRAWSRWRLTTERLQRYDALRRAGATRGLAVWACTGESRTEAALDVLASEAVSTP